MLHVTGPKMDGGDKPHTAPSALCVTELNASHQDRASLETRRKTSVPVDDGIQQCRLSGGGGESLRLDLHCQQLDCPQMKSEDSAQHENHFSLKLKKLFTSY